MLSADADRERKPIIQLGTGGEDVDLLLIKLERIDDNFYKSLIKFISDHGYTPEVVVRNTDSFSINGLEIISSKRQLFLHKKEVPMTNKEFDILELLARN